MNKLEDVQQAVYWVAGESDAEAADGDDAQKQKVQLVADLKSIISNNENYFRLCIAGLAVIFIASCAAIYVYRSSTIILTGLFTATGVSFAGITPQMFRYWREKVRTDAVLVLARQLPSSQTLELITLLLATPKK